MEETVLLYNFENTEVGKAITTILQQLQVKVKHIAKSETVHPLGYLLEIEGFMPGDEEKIIEMEEPMLVIHAFTDKQINIMLELFKQASIPFIPLKAVVTEQNVYWPFCELHEHVKEEFEMMHGVTKKN